MNNAILDLFAATKTAMPSSTVVSHGSFRLDAAFYSADSVDAQTVLSQSGARIQRLEELADVHCSGVRGRSFVDRTFGIPLLTGSTLDVTTDDDLKHISKVLTRNIASEALQSDDILISSAGTVGKADFVHRNHEGRLASQDVIRIRPNSANPPPGYVYAFITSQIAQRLIINQPAGSVIVRVYEENLEALTVPRLAPSTEARIARLITASFDARTDAKLLLASADVEVHACNVLSRLPDQQFSRHSIEDEPEIVTPTSRDLQSHDGRRSEYRLDAHFYNPMAQMAIANIRKCGSEVKTVVDVTRGIRMSPLFVRKYVAKEHGVPYIAGKQISQIRPEFKYISRNATEDLDDHILHEGWTLVTCAGSVGKVGYVSGALIGAAAQDVMRVIPDEMKVDGGYLNAWLASEYGRVLVVRCRYGSVVDRVSPQHVGSVLIPLPSAKEQRAIGGKVREAYEKRAEAIRLEDEAQVILMKELTRPPGTERA